MLSWDEPELACFVRIPDALCCHPTDYGSADYGSRNTDGDKADNKKEDAFHGCGWMNS
jgi:hypothetical protein